MSVDYLLHESALGYAIFKVVKQPDTIGNRLKEVQEAVQDLAKFGKTVELVGLTPFQGTQDALQEINDVSEGILSPFLQSTLESNLPKSSKKKKVVLGIWEKNLAGSIKAQFEGVQCETGETNAVVADLLRGLRQHGDKLVKQLQPGDLERSVLGLGHAYSRAKVKFSVAKHDNHIIQAIATLDQIDKDLNQFTMRLRENYGWHFPELSKILTNDHYAGAVLFIGDKSGLSDEKLHELAAVVGDDESVAQAIIKAARTSMGREISDADLEMVMSFARRTDALAVYRKQLAGYLSSRLQSVAPNTAALIGDTVAARLISKAGSLTNLSKYPASTVQILGAEKALFRALKTKGNTPKYGLIYHSSFIGKTGAKSKGRISRFLANKVSIASRIDNFSETPTSKFGEALKRQVDERIEFYASGATPAKNATVMQAAMDSVMADIDTEDPTAHGAEDVVMADGVTAKATEQAMREKKKEKKSKKSKDVEEEVSDKKSKKEKKRKHADEEDGEGKKKKKKNKA
ncbi:Nop domain-containing protein [Paraphaeosphaeria sporulosa]|uniref:Nucleolar protein 56 n=1 Tax=Paraphaeosphaeria sporulosa TaxID=1460663 RepID=A0A177BYJ5_9PLEO|nr:Nop domain-containing protein [Paraphaeosphaeria sporulosa]OAF99768.1 Nop domain-containing protein [Paraphaeosphaeria sporulosa]